MDTIPSAELYRKYEVQDTKSKLDLVVVMTRPTRKFLLTLYHLRIEGRGPYHLEKKTEKYLEDNFP
jgi:hypothetical protein